MHEFLTARRREQHHEKAFELLFLKKTITLGQKLPWRRPESRLQDFFYNIPRDMLIRRCDRLWGRWVEQRRRGQESKHWEGPFKGSVQLKSPGMHHASRQVVARENQYSAGGPSAGPSACTVIVAEVLHRVIRGGQDAITTAVLDECVLSVRFLVAALVAFRW